MTTLEALDRLLGAVKELADLVYDQAKIIEEQEAIDDALKADLDAHRERIQDAVQFAKVVISDDS
jgi:hypothetical protein